MKDKKTFFATFWQGYANVLDDFPKPRRNTKRFIFRGRDLSETSVAEALEQDWRMVEASIVSALKDTNEQRELEPCTR